MIVNTIGGPASGSSAAATRRASSLRRFAFLAVAMCTLSIAMFGVARADAETVVNFDGLEAGKAVTTQYEAQGLKLGSAKDVGGPSPGNGDCGSPTVRDESEFLGFEAASKPRYAVLSSCDVGAKGAYNGTFGALVGNPGDRVGVEARLLASAPPEQVEVIAYDTAGHELASAKGEVTGAGWLHVGLTVAGAAQIRYFAIRTESEYASGALLAIDNLSFDQPNEGGGSHPPPPPPPPVPPTVALSLQTPNPTPGKLLTLDGSASQPGSGRIISYGWDFNDDGKIDTSTGTNPIAHVMLGPGAHTIALTVTNSKGEHSTSKIGLTLPPTGPKVAPARWRRRRMPADARSRRREAAGGMYPETRAAAT